MVGYSSNKCKHCGNFIPIKRKRDEAKIFCNRACASRCLFLLPLVPCPICKKLMSPANKRQFCSVKCRAISSRSTYYKPCLHCGKLFLLKNKAFERRGGGKLCSVQCSRNYNKKYSFTERYFFKIDSERKAYWLGFIMADGYNSGREMVVNLKQADEKHLYKLLVDMNSNHKIYRLVHKGKYKGVIKSHNIANIRISSCQLCNDLSKLGCVKAKSLIVKFPSHMFPAPLLRHFVRGYFDGDGCISFAGKRKNLGKITFYSGSVLFVQALASYLNSHGIKCHPSRNGNAIYISRQELIKKTFLLMYTRATVCLDRKYERFRKLPILMGVVAKTKMVSTVE